MNSITPTAPIRNAMVIEGVRNCQTETPAARATINSWLRVMRDSAKMLPNSTANGVTCWAV